ncbi:hypothetical protein [Azospirillum sp. TSO35-2]|uniref:hypothetical protein n=1 Tax=Azospirillum sp. TSO35-2 TaxID=716796 RepID=UPI0011B358D4|nr:hypothetical protein [Azospirillum sp. TSO35-2]
MALPGNSYEVQVYQADHWVLDRCFESEAEARAYGKRILAGGRIEGIRVVRDWARPDGRHVETELHQEFRSQSNAILIAPIDEPPPLCHRAEDVFAVEGRMVINRLLRNYVDRVVVTPTELLHNHAELKRLQDKDNLFASAVGRVAALQAERAKIDGRARRDELYGLLSGVTERARAAAGKALPPLGPAGFAHAIDALAACEAPEECGFLGRVLLSRELVAMRNWLAKLDFLGELVRQGGGLPAAPLALVDGVIADVMGAPSVAQELLGPQGSMAEALCNLIDLSRGRLDVARRPEDDRAVQMNELFAFHDLTDARRVVLDLVQRQLKGNQPLYRPDPTRERDAFAEVLARSMAAGVGLVGGPGMAEALVLRYLRFLEAGGATGRRKAMEEVVGLIADAGDGVRFLLALAQSELGRQQADDVVRLLDRATGDARDFPRFIRRTDPIKSNLERLTTLYQQVVDSAAPELVKARLADNIDTLLVAYIHESHVVERLDNPADPLRHRANRLMQLCAPGTLRSGKALSVVRQRVIGHLRQPQFEEKYVADLTDPALRQSALREFHRLLGQAGLV